MLPLLRTRLTRRLRRTAAKRIPTPAGGRTAGRLVGDLTRDAGDDLVPLLRVGGRVRLEGELVRHAHLGAQGAAAGVLALDVELLAVDGSDEAVRQVERGLRGRVLGEVVVGFEFVQVFARGDDVEGRVVAFEQLWG